MLTALHKELTSTNDNNNNNNNIYFYSANSTVQFSNALYNVKIIS